MSLGGLAKVYQDIQGLRIALGNKTWASENAEGRAVPAIYESMIDQLKEMEKGLMKEAAQQLKTHPAWVHYGKHVKGLGTALASQLFGYIGDIGRFPTVSKLWKYTGLAVVDGQADRMRRGQKAGYNPKIKSLLYNIGTSFIKSRSPYRMIYDDKKKYYGHLKQDIPLIAVLEKERKRYLVSRSTSHKYLDPGEQQELKENKMWLKLIKHLGDEVVNWPIDLTIKTARAMKAETKKDECWKAILEEGIKVAKANGDLVPWTDNRVHLAAMRKMENIFLAHLWVAWREAEGLETREEYVFGVLGHKTKYHYQDFIKRK